ncbi:serine/threonine-protein kinase [Kitasatospora purpeofusca]|uniref:serine/threonine-protein kinase n=1 Tax=Kitasatospora purpeofusca TaxID=67352 RepID=UPI002252B7AF|nr:serine/threonine-protein kinase [Kitasatospora purpeofusca]MCX4689743.1 serine/threonine-protein kinase [Kitasatospora purpeofusca]
MDPPGARPSGGGAGFAVPAGYPVGGYLVGERIGAGGWGSVHVARAAGPDRVPGGELDEVAVKFLHPGRLGPGQRQAVAQAARSEIRFSRRADHPHLIRTFAVLTLADPDRPELDGAVALVMERAARSLYDLLAEARPPHPPPGAERILTEVAAGLRHMHGSGWVHGDLKPGNVLLMADGTAKLADFGLTSELEGTHAYAPPLGSPDHVPPEWWSERTGARGAALRPSADLWAYGVLAHQVLTGGLHPFLGATARARSLAAVAYARGSAPLRLDAALPERWRPLVTACLTADRRRRAELDLGALLAGALGGSGSGGGGVSVVTRTADVRPGPATSGPATSGLATSRRRKRRGRTAGRVALLLSAAAGLLFLTGAPERPESSDSLSGGPGRAARARAVPARPGAIPPGADVPAALRGPIDDAARRCPEPEITPALLAAMLKAESGFDQAASHPDTGEYGVAMWTPAVFNAWAQDADHDGVKNYLDPDDAIAAMGGYVCWLDQRFKQRGFPATQMPALVTAGYRTSDKTVADAGGVPERVKGHVALVLGYLAEYGGSSVAGP